MYMCIYVYVYVYVCMYVCMYACMHVCNVYVCHACMHVYVCICIHATEVREARAGGDLALGVDLRIRRPLGVLLEPLPHLLVAQDVEKP